MNGPNVGVNPNTATRNPEAIIRPGTSDTKLGMGIRFYAGRFGTVSNVTINGFTIAGDMNNDGVPNAATGIGDFPQWWNFPSNPLYLQSLDNNTSLGWETSLSNITIVNNVIRNFAYDGIALNTYSGYSENNIIANNQISHLQWIAAPTSTLCWDGVGIFLRNEVYAQVNGNSITNAQTGIVFSMDAQQLRSNTRRRLPIIISNVSAAASSLT